MARGNHSGLKGEPDSDSIGFKWFPTYNPVEKFRLYIKEMGKKEF